eukprot:185192-Alexandrium_andersonii.AAC.1
MPNVTDHPATHAQITVHHMHGRHCVHALDFCLCRRSCHVMQHSWCSMCVEERALRRCVLHACAHERQTTA